MEDDVNVDPETQVIGGESNSSSSDQTDLDLLSDESSETETSEDTSSEETGEVDEAETEVELDETSDEEAETETEEDPDADLKAENKPHFKAIKEKYPNFFKDFPAFRDTVFREQKFSNVFPTPEVAQQASERIQLFEGLRTELERGQIGTLLDTFEPEVANELARNFLPTIAKGDPNLFVEITTPFFANILRKAISEGTGLQNKNLVNASKVISKYLFGTFDPPKLAPKQKSNEPDPEKQRLESELNAVRERDATTFFEDVRVQGHTKVVRKIEVALDPEKKLSPTVRKAIVNEIRSDVSKIISKDRNYSAKVRALLQNAKNSGFSGEFKPRIVSAYLGRVNQILPKLVEKARAEVFGTQGLVNKGTTVKQPVPQSGRVSKTKPKYNLNDPKSIPASVSDLDILNAD